MGSTAPAIVEMHAEPSVETGHAVEVGLAPSAESLRDTVLNALSNQPMLSSLLETANWTLEGNALIAKVAASNTMIEMSFTSEARRVATGAASGAAGRALKVQVVPGGAAQTPVQRGVNGSSGNGGGANGVSNGSARSRAEHDPVVRRMQDKFGAEIRTVIDYREKGRS